MIFGDPFKFAFFIDEVPEWSSSDFDNGFFAISVDGILYPPDIRCFTLNVILHQIFSDISPFITLPESEMLFNDCSEIAFEKLQNITFPENLDVDNDYTYRMQITEFEDAGYVLFVVRFMDKIKFLLGEYNNENLRFNYTHEIIIEQTIINEMLIEIAKTYKHLLLK